MTQVTRLAVTSHSSHQASRASVDAVQALLAVLVVLAVWSRRAIRIVCLDENIAIQLQEQFHYVLLSSLRGNQAGIRIHAPFGVAGARPGWARAGSDRHRVEEALSPPALWTKEITTYPIKDHE